MSTIFSRGSAQAAEAYELEHRFPLGWMMISLLVSGNVGSAVMMLIAQS